MGTVGPKSPGKETISKPRKLCVHRRFNCLECMTKVILGTPDSST